MFRIGIVIGTVVIMLVGVGIASGQSPPNETSTPAAIGTPTPDPVLTDALNRTLIRGYHCNAKMLAEVLESPYELKGAFGPYKWDPNGEMLTYSYQTNWINSEHGSRGVFCMTRLYENDHSAHLDNSYETIRALTEWDRDNLGDVKARGLPELDFWLKVLHMTMGNAGGISGGRKPSFLVEVGNYGYGSLKAGRPEHLQTVGIFAKDNIVVIVGEWQSIPNNVSGLYRHTVSPPEFGKVVAISKAIEAKFPD